MDSNLNPSAQRCPDGDNTVPLETVWHRSREHVGHRQWLEFFINIINIQIYYMYITCVHSVIKSQCFLIYLDPTHKPPFWPYLVEPSIVLTKVMVVKAESFPKRFTPGLHYVLLLQFSLWIWTSLDPIYPINYMYCTGLLTFLKKVTLRYFLKICV